MSRTSPCRTDLNRWWWTRSAAERTATPGRTRRSRSTSRLARLFHVAERLPEITWHRARRETRLLFAGCAEGKPPSSTSRAVTWSPRPRPGRTSTASRSARPLGTCTFRAAGARSCRSSRSRRGQADAARQGADGGRRTYRRLRPGDELRLRRDTRARRGAGHPRIRSHSAHGDGRRGSTGSNLQP